MKRKYQIFNYILLFIVFLSLLSIFKNAYFFSDEADNMLGGMTIARGGHVYVDFPSQHMPLMYYIMSLFSFIGIKGTIMLRLVFYVLLSLIWVLMYKRYNKYVGKIPMIMYPILFIFMMANYQFGYAVLSEQIEAQCLVILLLEFIMFNKTKKLEKYSDIIIGLSIFISIFTAFVSIIPILVFVIGMLIIDIKEYKKNNKKIKKYFNYFFKNYYKLLIFTLVPSIIVLLIIIITGGFKDFINQAFYINLKIYPKYLDYSTNMFFTFFKSIIDYVKYNIELIKDIPIHKSSIFKLVFIIINIISIYIGIKKNKLLSIIIIIYILMCGNRGYDGFHSIPYFATSIIIYLILIKNENKKVYLIYLMIPILFLSVQYIKISKELVKPIDKVNFSLDRKLTENNNYIYYYSMKTYNYVDSELIPASRFTTLVPWFSELYEDNVLKDIRKNKPNVIYYDPNSDVWSHKYKIFAKKLDKYIRKNYSYNKKNKIWIINNKIDYIESILKNKKYKNYNSHDLIK